MSYLLQTPYPASGRIRQIFTGAVTPSEDTVNTPAGTHDGDDETADKASGFGDGIITGHIAYAVDYVIDPAGVVGRIDFVRVRLRQQKLIGSGSGTYSIQPLIAGVARGTPDTSIGLMVDTAWDFPTDPSDATAWTLAKVNAKVRWGFTADVAAFNPFSACSVKVAEITVELWGVVLAATLTGVVEAGALYGDARLGVTGEVGIGALHGGVRLGLTGQVEVL